RGRRRVDTTRTCRTRAFDLLLRGWIPLSPSGHRPLPPARPPRHPHDGPARPRASRRAGGGGEVEQRHKRTEKQGMGETLAGAWNCGAAARGAGRAATEGGLGVEPFGAAVMEREGGSGPRAPSGASDGAGPAHARGPPGPR
ncbi:unnamed protein product, partial [Prorocentrum cordatum]